MQKISWLPVDTAASALLDLAFLNRDAGHFYHLVSPKPVNWNTFMSPLSETLRVPLVPYDSWLSALQERARMTSITASTTPVEKHIPAFSLLEFFANIDFGEGIPLSMENTLGASKSLATYEPLGRDDAIRCLQYWRRSGLLSDQNGRVQ